MKLLASLCLFIVAIAAQAGEKDLYDFNWLDPDKTVYVLQNKLFRKEKRIYIGVGYIFNDKSNFQDSNGINLKTSYFFDEEWAVEASFQKYSNSNNASFANVKFVNGSVPFVRRFNSGISAHLIWSPFYGKINTFNQIFYFDWSFGVGYSRINAESNVLNVDDKATANQFDEEDYNAISLKSTFTFHINQSINFNIDYVNSMTQENGPKDLNTKKLKNTGDIVLSVGFSF